MTRAQLVDIGTLRGVDYFTLHWNTQILHMLNTGKGWCVSRRPGQDLNFSKYLNFQMVTYKDPKKRYLPSF